MINLFYFASISRIWDLSLEKDEEEEAEFKAQTREQVNAPEDLPPQLLFVHQVLNQNIEIEDACWLLSFNTLSAMNRGRRT